MQKNERFMVRTVTLENDKFVYRNTLADGRPAAVRQAERIGQIDQCDHKLVRAFLEGHDESSGVLEVLAKAADGYNAANIYRIDD